VIDPGPDDSSHIDAILAAGAGRIRWILVTHTHEDHSPAALRLAGETGAELRGAPAPPDDPTRIVRSGPTCHSARSRCWLPREFRLRAIHTPGHVANHYCVLLEDEGTLMTGDHIMNGSTVVIIPPSGDMHDYLESLHRLRALPLQRFAPGHGALMPEPPRQRSTPSSRIGCSVRRRSLVCWRRVPAPSMSWCRLPTTMCLPPCT
jgi:glyoxylase-like metal-dependent hydrolase (beta-lactamase superfamily II)